jgi:hypothetical protein
MTTITVHNVQAPAPAGVPRTNAVSASADSKPSAPVTWACMIIVAVAVVGMWLLFAYVIKPKPIKIQTGYVPFAGLVVVTAALERLLQPLSMLFGVPSTAATADASSAKKTAAAAAADPAMTVAEVAPLVQEAADKQAPLDANKANRTVVFWAIASVLGVLVSGGFGFFLLQSVASATTPVNTFLDLAVTGLAIGAGTKPLHDLITSLQAKASTSAAT